MLDYNFLRILSDYVKIYKEFPLPAIIADAAFEVHWSNRHAKKHYRPITEATGLSRILADFNRETIHQALRESGNFTVYEALPFSGIQLSISPILVDGQIEGVVVLLMGAKDLPEASELYQTSKAANALSNSIRSTVGEIFNTMDIAAVKADFMEADWIKSSFNRIGFNNYRILRIAANITEYAKYQNGFLDMHFEIVDIFGMLRDMSQTIRLLADGMGIPVRFEIPDRELYIRMDMERIEAAFTNILHNSLYYTRPDNRVTIRAFEKHSNAMIEVEDRGLGIPADKLPDLVQPYVSYPHGGVVNSVGLGLTLAQIIVEAHEGELRLSSSEGVGTTATVSLPKNSFSHAAPLRQGDLDRYRFSDRFSGVYTGLSDAILSPFRTE